MPDAISSASAGSPAAPTRRWLAPPRGLTLRSFGVWISSPGRLAAALVWLAFLAFPVFDAVGTGARPLDHVVAIVGTLAFTAIYLTVLCVWQDAPRLAYVLSACLLAITCALTAGINTNWGFLFSYVAACAGLVLPSPYGVIGGLFTAAAALATTLGADGSIDKAAGYAASSVGVGLLLTLMRDLRMRNVELDEARAELARTAVAAERERFARDLHDLLGHSLSVIAIKAELAGRLLPGDPARAGVEVSDLEAVARTALGEVREAVSGYRQPTLDGELEGARVALSAAGIAVEFDRGRAVAAPLAPDVEAVLAWAVREGATNVIRHSGARRCAVRVRAGHDTAAVEVVDDGGGCAARDGGPTGNGLAGLRERAAQLRGRLEAGSATDGGFRLLVSVPLAAGHEGAA